jgi:hypothetical protein
VDDRASVGTHPTQLIGPPPDPPSGDGHDSIGNGVPPASESRATTPRPSHCRSKGKARERFSDDDDDDEMGEDHAQPHTPRPQEGQEPQQVSLFELRIGSSSRYNSLPSIAMRQKTISYVYVSRSMSSPVASSKSWCRS